MAQRFVRQMKSQAVRINQWGQDNSFATDKQDEIRFGKGGVDDAEDAEVILHEYGHAIHFSQSPTFYTSVESGLIGEGFGDYWAVTVSNVIAPTPDRACVADCTSFPIRLALSIASAVVQIPTYITRKI